MLETVQLESVTLATADKMIGAAMEEAGNLGMAACIAILDPHGNEVAFKRMDGAPLLSIDIAKNKAYTAVSFGLASHEWHGFIAEDDPLRLGIVHTPRLVVFGGGYPITSDAGIVGGIGVSGGHYTDDMKVAAAGLASIGITVE